MKLLCVFLSVWIWAPASFDSPDGLQFTLWKLRLKNPNNVRHSGDIIIRRKRTCSSRMGSPQTQQRRWCGRYLWKTHETSMRFTFYPPALLQGVILHTQITWGKHLWATSQNKTNCSSWKSITPTSATLSSQPSSLLPPSCLLLLLLSQTPSLPVITTSDSN